MRSFIALVALIHASSCLKIQLSSRRAALHGAAAAAVASLAQTAHAEEGDLAKQGAMGGRVGTLGSKGISAYEQLKLDKALGELKEASEVAGPNIKPTIELLLTSTLPKVRDENFAAIDTEKISIATNSLLGLADAGGANSDSSLQAQAESMVKLGAKLIAAVNKRDEGAAAMASVSLANELTDFAYEYGGKDRPLPEMRVGFPAPYTPGLRRELPVSGKTI